MDPTLSDETCWNRVRELFTIRVFRYVSDGWIFLPFAIQLAEEASAQADESFKKLDFVSSHEIATQHGTTTLAKGTQGCYK